MLHRGTAQPYPNLTAGCHGEDEGSGHTAVQGQGLARASDSCHAGVGLTFGIRLHHLHPCKRELEGSCRRAAGERAALGLRRRRLCPPCWPRSWVQAELQPCQCVGCDGHAATPLPRSVAALGARLAACAGVASSPGLPPWAPAAAGAAVPLPPLLHGRWAGAFQGRECTLPSNLTEQAYKIRRTGRGGGRDKIR